MHALCQSQDCRAARRLARKNMDSVTFPSTTCFTEMDTHHMHVDTTPVWNNLQYIRRCMNILPEKETSMKDTYI
jgi:hypothetical protein